MFNKEEFVLKNGYDKFNFLLGFLEEELNLLDDNFKRIIHLENLRKFEYEGNIYWIIKHEDNSIELKYEIANDDGFTLCSETLKLKMDEFLLIVTEAREILKKYALLDQ